MLLTSHALSVGSFTDLGMKNDSQCTIRDLWLHENLGVVMGKVSMEVAPHDVRMIVVTP